MFQIQVTQIKDNVNNDKNVNRRNYVKLKVEQKLMLKFTRSYCVTLHQDLANRNFAPKIYHHEKIGNWQMIFMEDLQEKFSTISKDEILTTLQFEKLKEAVTSFHEKDWVHGDLRRPNILRSKTSDDIMLIDFDWSGKYREARYPVYLNPELPWPNGVAPNALIDKEHDINWLNKLDPNQKME